MQDRIDRVNKVIEHLRITKHNLASTSGIAPSNFVKMMAGEQTITDKTLIKIAEAYPEINLNWMKTGEGEMLNPKAQSGINGDNNVLQDGRGGHHFTQTNNSDKILTEFIEGLKAQGKLTERSMSQTDKALEEVSEQRKLVERLVSIIEKDKAENK